LEESMQMPNIARILAAGAFVAAVGAASTANAAANGNVGQQFQANATQESGQATGKRTHKPIRARMYYDQRPGGSVRSR
jgi:hypothetical protein